MTVMTPRSTTGTLGRLAIGLAALTTAAGLVSTADATSHAQPDCRFGDHPAAADLAPLLPALSTPPVGVRAVLLGEVTIGTNCSIDDPQAVLVGSPAGSGA